MSVTPNRHVQSRFVSTLARSLLALALLLLVGGTIGTASAFANGNIVAMKGGDRSASDNASGATNYASPLSGALFEYTTGNPTSPATTWTAFPAVTAANGQATASVPAGTYYVRERTPGPGFTNFGPVTTLSYAGPHPYVARVTVTDGQTTYAYPHTNTNATPGNWTPTNGPSATNNGSPFLNVRDNGTVAAGCGTNILLVLDRSGSIEPYRTQYEAAAKQFVASLNGTPTQIGIISFNNAVNSYQPAQGSSSFYQSPLSLANAGSAATLNGVIEDIYDSPNSLTNWDGVLQAAAQAKSFTADANTGQTTNPDMVVFITDGNPTTSEVSTSNANEDLINLTSGMASANLVKNQASRAGTKLKLLAIGVGNGVTVDNLKVVSGPDEGVDGDYATPTVQQLNAFLTELAAAQCGARVYVRKHLTGQATNQANWFYTAVDPRPGFNPTYLDNNRATHSTGNPPVIETGAFFDRLPATPTTVNVNEDAAGQPITNFDLVSVDCRYDSYTGNPVAGGVRNGLQFSLPVSRGDAIYCTYTNTARTTLAVNKTPDNQTINAGDTAEFQIQVTNTGTNTAVGATLTDPLPPAGVGGWTITQQPGGCAINAGTLNCAFGNLNPGQSVTVRVSTGTSFALCATYDNLATAQASNAAQVSNAGKITCQKPNLSVEKSGNGPIQAGQDATFEITVGNAGPGVAKSVTLSDPLPGGTAGPWAITAQPPGNPCSIAGGTLNCNFGDLASGQEVEVTVSAPTDATDCGVYNNVATAGGSNHPAVNDSAAISCSKPSLGTLKTAVQATISAGDNAQFEITVGNAGPGTATDVTLNDPLPASVAGPWTIVSQPAGNPCAIVAGVLECDFGDMAPGTEKTVKVEAPTNFENCSQLVNLATASASNAPDASDGATIMCDRPNLSVEKTGNGPVNAGEDVSFSVTVSNAGPGIARSVTLADPLPGGTAGSWTIDSQPAGDPCAIVGAQLDCDFGDLAAGQSRTVVVVATTDAENCGIYDNTATASATNSPSAMDQASVRCLTPDLTVEKSGNGTVNAGEDVEFTITVSNAGPGTATSVSLSDPLPAGTAGAWSITSQPVGDPCAIVGAQLDCSFGDMASGTSHSVTVVASTDAEECATYDNTVVASSTNAPDATDSASVECLKPDLSVAKSGNGPVNAGENVTFTMTVENGGPGTAKSVELSDPLPAGIAGTWSITSQPADLPCAIVAGQLNCEFGDLAAGASRSVTVSAATDIENCTTYDNTASGTAENHAPFNGQASVECLKPDLSIDKTGNGPVNAGEDIVFTVTVSNAGPGRAKGVQLNDPLPTGVAGGWEILTQPAGDPCEVVADLLGCDFGDMDAGSSAQVIVKAPTSHDACKVFDNTAVVFSTNAPDATDSASVECLKPELGALKTAVEASISAGDTAEFEITVSNTGPGTAKAVELNDPLPGGVAGPWTITSQPAGDPCEINAGVLSCEFGDLPSGESRVVKVEALTNFENCSELINLATASASNAPDASDQASIICNRPDLSVEKTGNGTVNAGENVSFSVTIRNAGPGVAKSATLNDPLPAGVSGAWSITDQPAGDPCAVTAGTLDCDFGDLAAGEERTVAVSAATDFEHCATYDNTATGSADNHPDVDATASVTCQKPDLEISKNGNGPIDAGEIIRFVMEVSNNGPGVAKAVVLTDALPSGTAGPWVVESSSQGTCEIADGELTCEFGDLAAGETASVTVNAPTDAECGTYDNTAEFTAENAPPGSADATVVCQTPQLRLEKRGNGPVKAGQKIRFTVTATNDGPGTATGVSLRDPLPNGIAGAWRVEATSAGVTCSINGRVLECDLGDLEAGQSRSVRVSARTSERKCGRYRNTAEVTAGNGAPVRATDTIACREIRPRLQLKKRANRTRVFPGDLVRYTILYRNVRPGSVARNLKICDRLPAKMTVAAKGRNSFFQNGKLCWRVRHLGYSRKWKRVSYTARVDDNANAGERLRNVVTLGNLRATRTVVVREPVVSPARRVTPVTG